MPPRKLNAPDGYRCFVIGPIGDELAPIGSPEHDRYEAGLEVLAKVIEPAAAKYKIPVTRADGIQKQGEIPEQVFEALRDFDLVIADLSGANPNVMYELAFRHATGKCVIEISEWGKLPFDVQWIRALEFVRTDQGFIDARKRLEGLIEHVLREGCGEVTATRVLRGLHQTAPATAGDVGQVSAELVIPDEELGFLDILAEMEEAMPLMSTDLQSIGGVITRLGTIATEGLADIEAANAQSGGSIGARMPAIARFAQRLEPETEELETLTARYAGHIDAVDRGLSFLIDRLQSDEDMKAQAGELPARIIALRSVADESLTTLDGLASTVGSLAPMSRVLRSPATRLSSSLHQIRLVSAPIYRWADGMKALFPDAAN